MKRLPWRPGSSQEYALLLVSDADKIEVAQALDSQGICDGASFFRNDINGKLAFPSDLHWGADGSLRLTIITGHDNLTSAWFWLVEHTGDGAIQRNVWWGATDELTKAHRLDDIEADESTAMKLVQWICDKGISGVPPLSSAEQLAREYEIDLGYENADERVDSLINWETTKNFTSGFITGLGGIIALPVAIPAAFGASWVIQARMAGAIARLYGHSLSEDRVKTLVLLALAGDAAMGILKGAGIQVGKKLTANLIRQIPAKTLREINKMVGFRLITKAGQTSVVTLTKFIPVVGGVIGGAFDAVTCRAVGRAATNLFRPPDQSDPSDPTQPT